MTAAHDSAASARTSDQTASDQTADDDTGDPGDRASAHARAGNLAQEASRLFEALQRAATDWSGVGEQDTGECAHTAPPECRACPVCQGLRRLQHVRPEVVRHLADATASLAAALNELTAVRTPPPTGPGEKPHVQHIDITD